MKRNDPGVPQPLNVACEALNCVSLRVHTFLWNDMRENTLSLLAVRHKDLCIALYRNGHSCVTGDVELRSHEVVEPEDCYLLFVSSGFMRSADCPGLNAAWAPAAIRGMIDIMFFDLLLCRLSRVFHDAFGLDLLVVVSVGLYLWNRHRHTWPPSPRFHRQSFGERLFFF